MRIQVRNFLVNWKYGGEEAKSKWSQGAVVILSKSTVHPRMQQKGEKLSVVSRTSRFHPTSRWNGHRKGLPITSKYRWPERRY